MRNTEIDQALVTSSNLWVSRALCNSLVVLITATLSLHFHTMPSKGLDNKVKCEGSLACLGSKAHAAIGPRRIFLATPHKTHQATVLLDLYDVVPEHDTSQT